MCMRGLWGVWVCGVLPRDLGDSILAFLGEWTTVAGCGGCSEWTGTGCLVGGRHLCVPSSEGYSKRSGGVLRGGPLNVVYLG